MTTHRDYRCDLCHDYIEPTDPGGLGVMGRVKAGFGIYFLPGDGKPVFKRPHEAEHHICNVCAHGIHDELRKVMPAKDAT